METIKNKLEIKDENCVNSKWPARFLAEEGVECCECSFGYCKVRVSITHNGHPPHEYILTGKEIEEARKRLLK
jgi:hypothetical protein